MKKKLLLWALICSGAANAQTYTSTKTFIGNTYSSYGAVSMNIDHDGNNIIAGTSLWEGASTPSINTDMDPGSGVALLPSSTPYIAKYNYNGNLIWLKNFSSPNEANNFMIKVETDANNNIYLLGRIAASGSTDSIDLDPSANNAFIRHEQKDKIFIAKYNSSGQFQFFKEIVKTLDTSSIQGTNAYDIIVEKNGNIAIAGSYKGTIDINPDPVSSLILQNNDNSYFRGYIAQYDTNLNFINGIGLTNSTYAYKLADDNLDNLYASTGKYIGDSITNRLQLIKYNSSNLTQTWIKEIKPVGLTSFGSYGENSGGVQTDNNNNVYLTGTIKASYQVCDFDPANPGVDTVRAIGQSNVFIAKYNSNGNGIWTKLLKGASTSQPSPYTADAATLLSFDITTNGNLVISGGWLGLIDFDPGNGTHTLQSNEYTHIGSVGNGIHYVAVYDSAGNYVSMHSLALGGIISTGFSYYPSAFIDCKVFNNNISVIGTFYGDAYFLPPSGGHVITPSYTSNLYYATGFLTKYNICQTISTSVSQSMCVGDTLQFGSEKLTSTGTYSRVLLSSNGCSDSVITLNLTVVSSVDTSVSRNNNTLTANINGASYQWIDCSTNTNISGAISKTFTPASPGSYKVAITIGSCSGTSNCYSIAPTGIDDINFANQINIYPNPANDILNIQSSQSIPLQEIIINDITGRSIKSMNVQDKKTNISIDVSHLNTGIYLIKIIALNNQAMFKFIKK